MRPWNATVINCIIAYRCFIKFQPNGNDSKLEMVPNGEKCTPDLKHRNSALTYYKVAIN